ncbi:MAG TPA: hypothetical protein VFN49_02990 [Candidatus Aquilonibacter sp.]|nr:hypothetical protein [Candidatus Aquilonibacter sp.]
MSMYDSNDTATERARSATDAISGTIRNATDNSVGRTAQGISESNERNDSQEPMNSMMRTILLSAAGLSVLGSLAMNFMGRKHEALFVGQWAPTLLIIALWYQEVKDARHVTGSINTSPSRTYNPTTSPYGGI